MEQYQEMKLRHVRELHDMIREAVHKAGGNRSEAARMIGMDRGAMLRVIRDHGIELRGNSAQLADAA